MSYDQYIEGEITLDEFANTIRPSLLTDRVHIFDLCVKYERYFPIGSTLKKQYKDLKYEICHKRYGYCVYLYGLKLNKVGRYPVSYRDNDKIGFVVDDHATLLSFADKQDYGIVLTTEIITEYIKYIYDNIL